MTRWVDKDPVTSVSSADSIPITQAGLDKRVNPQILADANESKASNIASAGTTDIGAASAPFLHVTGTTTITALGTVQAGTRRIVVFDGILILTHNATSLILPTGANITTAAGDVAVFVSEGSGNWRCVNYTRADGTALAGGSGGGASIGVQYSADTGSTADSDPGAGLMKWNNATQAISTELYLDDTTTDGVSLTGWWSALEAGGFAYLQHATDQDTWQIWQITDVTDASGYVKLAVSLLADGGSFSDDAPMLVTLQQGPAAVAVTSVNGDTGAVVLTEGDIVATINDETASYTAVLSDEVVIMDNAAANDFTVPPNSSVAFAVGRSLEVWQKGAGQTTIVAGSGVTILYHADNTLKLKGQNSGCSLRKVATDTWRLIGDMELA